MVQERSDLQEWIISDLEEITNFFQQKRIDFIIQNYPPNIIDNSTPAHENIQVDTQFFPNSILRNFASTHNFPFYDLEKDLGFLWKQGKKEIFFSYFPKAFGRYDAHLNSKGYLYNAEALFKIIEPRIREMKKDQGVVLR